MSTLADLRNRYAAPAIPAIPAIPVQKIAEIAEIATQSEPERNTPAHRAYRRTQARARLVKRLLHKHPDVMHFYYTDDKADPRYIVLCIGLQGVGTADIWIPRENYDPFRVIEIVHGHSQRDNSESRIKHWSQS